MTKKEKIFHTKALLKGWDQDIWDKCNIGLNYRTFIPDCVNHANRIIWFRCDDPDESKYITEHYSYWLPCQKGFSDKKPINNLYYTVDCFGDEELSEEEEIKIFEYERKRA